MPDHYGERVSWRPDAPRAGLVRLLLVLAADAAVLMVTVLQVLPPTWRAGSPRTAIASPLVERSLARARETSSADGDGQDAMVGCEVGEATGRKEKKRRQVGCQWPRRRGVGPGNLGLSGRRATLQADGAALARPAPVTAAR